MERRSVALLVVTWVCWILGLVLPIVELIPFPVLHGQDLPSFMQINDHLSDRTTKSTWGTLNLLREREYLFAFAILLTSSIVIPILKLSTASLVLLDSSMCRVPPRLVTVLASLSCYQLVDLFLGILFVAFCNSDAFEARLCLGFCLFASYCVLSQALMLSLESELETGDPSLSSEPDMAHEDSFLYAHSPTRAGIAKKTAGDKRPRKLEADMTTAFWNGIVFLLLAYYGNHQPILDTAITFNGIALSRTRLGLHDLAMHVTQQTHVVACSLLVATIIVAPLLVGFLAFAGGFLQWCHGEDNNVAISLLHLGHWLAPWVTADVLALSLVTFLFAVQGDHLHTTIPDGTAFGITTDWFSGFYVCLGLGAAAFSLKWKAVHWHHDEEDDSDLEYEQVSGADVSSTTPFSMDSAENDPGTSSEQLRAPYATVPGSENDALSVYQDSLQSRFTTLSSVPSVDLMSLTPKHPISMSKGNKFSSDGNGEISTPGREISTPGRPPPESASLLASPASVGSSQTEVLESQPATKQIQVAASATVPASCPPELTPSPQNIMSTSAAPAAGNDIASTAPKLEDSQQVFAADTRPMSGAAAEIVVSGACPDAEVSSPAKVATMQPDADKEHHGATAQSASDNAFVHLSVDSSGLAHSAELKDRAEPILAESVNVIGDVPVRPHEEAMVTEVEEQKQEVIQLQAEKSPNEERLVDNAGCANESDVVLSVEPPVAEKPGNVQSATGEEAVEEQPNITVVESEVIQLQAEEAPNEASLVDANFASESAVVPSIEPPVAEKPGNVQSATGEEPIGEQPRITVPQPEVIQLQVEEAPNEASLVDANFANESVVVPSMEPPDAEKPGNVQSATGEEPVGEQPRIAVPQPEVASAEIVETAVVNDGDDRAATVAKTSHADPNTGTSNAVNAETAQASCPDPAEVALAQPGDDVEMALGDAVRELQQDATHGAGPPGGDGDTSMFATDSVKTQTRGKSKSRCQRLLGNPIFHVKAASWIIWGVCYFCVKGPEELTYMKVNHALEGVLPLLNNVMNHTLPRTLGDCNASSLAPPPCVGAGPIYAGKTSGIGMNSLEEQHVLARWVTGVNTIHLKSISLQVIPDSRKPIEIGISGEVTDMKMSILIEQCLFGVCKTLWDGTGGCCEPRRQFKLVIATDCVNNDAGIATLGNFKVEWFNIDDITLKENLLGFFHEELADLTPRVKKSVQALTTDVFQGDTVFLNLTFAQVVSRLWRYNTAGGARCSDFLADSE